MADGIAEATGRKEIIELPLRRYDFKEASRVSRAVSWGVGTRTPTNRVRICRAANYTTPQSQKNFRPQPWQGQEGIELDSMPSEN